MIFDGWLDARDGETLARAWAALPKTKAIVGIRPPFVLGIQPLGAARLAAAWLQCSPERFAWFAIDDPENAAVPRPVFEERRAATRCFLEGAIDCTEADLGEHWRIREVIEGTRGVQLIKLGFEYGPMTREGGNGGSAMVVRLFDRSAARGVSFQLHSNDVYLMGEPVDLSPLDLFAHRVSYKLRWATLELAAVRGFIAQLTADLDAHFDTSAEWEGGVTRDEVLESVQYNFRTRRREFQFCAGPYAIELGENLDPDIVDDASGMFAVTVRGLPFGHQVSVRIALSYEPGKEAPPAWGVDGWIDFTLPLAQLEAAVARTAAIPGIELT
jgi:hypothetical protein